MFKDIHTTITDVGIDPITIQTGIVAKQANASVLVSQGETVVLATATASREPKEGADFLPLTVDYREPSYAAGKIPGGFFKRQGRPTTKETISSRLADRPLRPLFPEGFTHDMQVLVSVLSFDQRNAPELLGVIGASAALHLSDIPFNGPIGCVRVGYIDGKFVVDPVLEQRESSELDLVIAGTLEAVCMVEARATHLSEDTVVEAISVGHEAIKRICRAQNELREQCGRPKFPFKKVGAPEGLVEKVQHLAFDRIRTAVGTKGKLEAREAMHQVHLYLKEQFAKEIEAKAITMSNIHSAVETIVERYVRQMMLEDGKRYDGRGFREIRPIHCAVGILPRTHGSALFTRGETQALAVTTLGITQDEQIIDGLEEEYRERFLLHYNFPPYSVGEIRPIRGPGRREIGHGELAKKSLDCVMPDKDKFPYTVRVVSEILESNGSSSMATVCSSTLSLLDAGVPIEHPISGVAMGLVKEGEKHAILTDIAGWEDHYGDMDFKVAGSVRGVTGLQMDIKISGVTVELMREALQQAKEARLAILNKMADCLAHPRPDISKYAPRIITIPIPNERIGMIIGPGGKTIRHMTEVTGCKIEIDDERNVVNIVSTDEKKAAMAKEMILRIIEDPEIGKIYNGKVVKIMNFGAFVEILPAHEGLVHISQLDFKRVNRVEDICQVGDVIPVKLTHVDDQGRISLSRKDALREMSDGPVEGGEEAGAPDSEPRPEREHRPEREMRADRGDRPDRESRGDRFGRRGGRDRDRGRGGRDRDRGERRPMDRGPMDRGPERAAAPAPMEEGDDFAEDEGRPVPQRAHGPDRGAGRMPEPPPRAERPMDDYDGENEAEEGGDDYGPESYEAAEYDPPSRGDYYEEEFNDGEEESQQPPPPADRDRGYAPHPAPRGDWRGDRDRQGQGRPSHQGPPSGGHSHRPMPSRDGRGGGGGGGYGQGRGRGPGRGPGGPGRGGPSQTRRRHS